MSQYIAAIDQGTTSTRCMLFNQKGAVASQHQLEHEQIYPRPGWVEHDPLEIWEKTQATIAGALKNADASARDIAAVGITNQRETTVLWDRRDGQPIHNALVWQDTRTDKLIAQLEKEGGQDRFRQTTGLPLATYFSGPKIRWLLDNVEGARQRAEAGHLLFGNIDTWLIWNLTGGSEHVTDVTNASRTLLMDLRTLQWDPEICGQIDIPMSMLPEIRSSSERFGATQEQSPFSGSVPICGILGDQQAATVGQACFEVGEAKNTYGTGCFMILNTGNEVIHSDHGLITTVCYRFGDRAPTYALEGSIAITGALVQWLRDNLRMFDDSDEVERLAGSVEDNGGVYFVPAFSGLFAPHWRSDARGVIVGLTRYANRGHIARAALEATAFQTREILDAMNADSGVALKSLKVDGGMVKNELLMQFQANVLGVPVIRPKIAETTALGAAYAAGFAVDFWSTIADMRDNWSEDKSWNPDPESDANTDLFRQWRRAVERSFGWLEEQEA